MGWAAFFLTCCPRAASHVAASTLYLPSSVPGIRSCARQDLLGPIGRGRRTSSTPELRFFACQHLFGRQRLVGILREIARADRIQDATLEEQEENVKANYNSAAPVNQENARLPLAQKSAISWIGR